MEVTVTMHDKISFHHPIARLRSIMKTIEPLRHQPEYGYHSSTGNLINFIQYFTAIIWVNKIIHPRFIDMYENEPDLFELMYHVDSVVEVHSKYLDDNLYDNYFYGNINIPQSWRKGLSQLDVQLPQPSYHRTSSFFDYLFASELLSSIRSSYSVVQPLKRIKIACFYGSLGLLGLSLSKLARGKVLLSSCMMFGSMESLRVSYNCYDRRYNTIYHNQLFGDIDRCKMTGTQMFSSLIGRIQPMHNPFYKVHHHINWKILVKDTLCEDIYVHLIDKAQLFTNPFTR